VKLSICVVDAVFGAPAADIPVGLQRTTVSGWIDLAKGQTGPDGRLALWQGQVELLATFQLEFDLDRYYAALGTETVFPRATVAFRAGDTRGDLYLTILTSPNLVAIYHSSPLDACKRACLVPDPLEVFP
jgi:5-hydroxyisourate hydrolase